MIRALLTNRANALPPCLGLPLATERWGGRPPQVYHKPITRHTYTRAALISSVGQYPAQSYQRNTVSAQYLGTNPKPGPGRRTASVACEPADPANPTRVRHDEEQQKSLQVVFQVPFVHVRGTSSFCSNTFTRTTCCPPPCPVALLPWRRLWPRTRLCLI